MYCQDVAEFFAFKCLVHKLVHIDVRTSTGQTFLHLAIDHRTSLVADEFYSQFPSAAVVDVLVECGADADALDDDGNTALYLSVVASKSSSADAPETVQIAESLLRRGAHVDAVNRDGDTALKHLSSSAWPKVCILKHVSLKCLAARVVRLNRIPYLNSVPSSLISFLGIH